jgi:hypothetical protein
MPIYPTKTVDYNFDDPACYPGSGTTVTDLQGILDLNFVGTPTFTSSAGNGSYFSFTAATVVANHLASAFDATFNGSFDFSYSFCIRVQNLVAVSALYGGLNSTNLNSQNTARISQINSSGNIWYSAVGYAGENITPTPVVLNKWVVVTVTSDYTNNQIKTYINGTLVKTDAFTTSYSFINPQVILGWMNSSPYFDTSLGDSDIKAFSIWKNVVLTGPQVQDVADGFIQFTNPPVMDLNASESTSYPGSGTTWSDLSAGNFDFTMSNPAFTAKTSSTPGYFTFPGRALTDPLTVYGEYNGTPAITTQSSWTDTVWVRRAADHLSYGQSRISIFANGREDLSGPDNGWALGTLNGAGNSNITIEASGVGLFDSGLSFTDNEWVMLSFVRSGSNITFYINGALISAQSFSYTTPADGMWISRTAGSLFSWIGDISIIRQFNIALTQPQIDEIYQYDLANYIVPNPPPPTPYAGNVGGRQFGQGFNG